MIGFNLPSAIAALGLASTVSALGQLSVINKCSFSVYIYQSTNGACNVGPNGICQGKLGAAPWTVHAGATEGLKFISNGEGTSVKIATNSSFETVLQFEYTVNNGLYWDLSDLDGAGPGLVGTPFSDYEVQIIPTGTGVGTGNCDTITCSAKTTCVDAYQKPDDADTRFCPSSIGNMEIELCG